MRFALRTTVIMMLLLAAPVVHAQSDQVLPFQGVITDQSGQVIAAGTTVSFSIYDSSLLGQGDLLWGPEARAVTPTNGVVSVLLGEVTPFDDLNIFDGRELFLSIEIAQNELTRIRVGHTVYAFNAARLEGNEATDFAGAGHGHQLDDLGDVAVAAPTDGQALTFQGGSWIPGDVSTGGDTDWTVSGDDMFAGVSGDVGIGTISPSRKLDVDGDCRVANDFEVSGASRNAVFDMDQSGDNSVSLPGGAISADECLNEPGIASNLEGSQLTWDSPHATPQALLSRTIDVPSAGYVVAIGTVQIITGFPSDDTVRGYFGVADVGNSFGSNLTRMRFTLPGISGETHTTAITSQGVYEITGAGTYTYYLLGQNTEGGYNIFQRHLTLMYFPTNYGTVTSP